MRLLVIFLVRVTDEERCLHTNTEVCQGLDSSLVMRDMLSYEYVETDRLIGETVSSPMLKS